MNNIYPESPAFPISATAAKQIVEGYGFPNEYLGLSIRAHIAAQTMAEIVGKLLTGPDMAAFLIEYGVKGEQTKDCVARVSLEYTDALIESLNK